jgi:hypothetical protein
MPSYGHFIWQKRRLVLIASLLMLAAVVIVIIASSSKAAIFRGRRQQAGPEHSNGEKSRSRGAADFVQLYRRAGWPLRPARRYDAEDH